MRQKRAKQYRKQMGVYRLTFKFKQPIQVLVDSNAILEAEARKFDLQKGIERTVQMPVKLFVTQCCINHLYESKNQAAIEICKTMEKRHCRHKETLSSYECIKDITDVDGENKYRYVVVTQDEKLRRKLRRIPAVPLIYMNRSVMIMEPMSPATEKVVAMVEHKKLTGGLNDASAGFRSTGSDDEEAPAKKKRKGPKGPNPLSMKKKQKREEEEGGGEEQKKKRKRRHRKGGASDAATSVDSAATDAALEEAVGVIEKSAA